MPSQYWQGVTSAIGTRKITCCAEHWLADPWLAVGVESRNGICITWDWDKTSAMEPESPKIMSTTISMDHLTTHGMGSSSH